MFFRNTKRVIDISLSNIDNELFSLCSDINNDDKINLSANELIARLKSIQTQISTIKLIQGGK